MKYVDFGSIEIVLKRDVRFLASRFGSFSIQALHCSLFETENPIYTQEINENFAILIDNNQCLEATFKKSMMLVILILLQFYLIYTILYFILF